MTKSVSVPKPTRKDFVSKAGNGGTPKGGAVKGKARQILPSAVEKPIKRA